MLRGEEVAGMPMTPKELVIAQIQHRGTDRVPYALGFEGDVADRLDARYSTSSWRALVDNAIRGVPQPNFGVDIPGNDPFVTDPYGSRWRVDVRPLRLVEPVLGKASLAGYRFPDLDAMFTPEIRERGLQFAREHPDHFLIAHPGFGVFERSWVLRGFENILADMAAEPDCVAEFVLRIGDHQLAILERLLEMPVDGILFGDDWCDQHGPMMGLERWRRWFKPQVKRFYAAAHEAGKYTLHHCCGSVTELIPDLIEIGLDVLESCQPEADGMDPYELKRRFGDRLTFYGCLGVQNLVPFGTPGAIRAEVTRLCREMGRGGGYILAPAKYLQPETPTENAAAVLESFLEQGGVHFPASVAVEGRST
jgi:uroporphyrinogen decarboxylase